MIERIGIVGGGQLGRMLTEAAKPLGFEVIVVDPVENCPAAQVGAEQIQAPLTDIDAISELAERTEVLTWEIEHIPADYLRSLEAEGVNVQPSPRSLQIIQDKLVQKQFLTNLGVRVAPFSSELDESSFTGGGPYMVKTRKGGFDGRGNLLVDSLDDPRIEEEFSEKPVYVEQAVDFEREVAAIAARDVHGNIALYPLVQTVHENSICNLVISPAHARLDRRTDIQARDIVHTVLRNFGGAGVFAIEMFDDGRELLVNEIAPRVHNSGHLTIEANATSQFEQHIRAVTGMPLGSTDRRATSAVMINILGTQEEPLQREGLERVLGMRDVHPHYYGKSSRPARKIGHITLLSDDPDVDKLIKQAHKAREALTI